MLADLASSIGWSLEQPNVDGGDAEEQRGAKVEELRRSLFVFKAFEQSHAASGEQPTMQPVAQRVNVEQRQRKQETIRGRDLPSLVQTGSVHGEVVVRQNRAFGCAGGSRCVDQGGGRLAIEWNFRQSAVLLRGLRTQSGQLFFRDEQFRLSVGQDMR